MAGPETCLLFEDSLVFLHVSTAKGLKIRTSVLSSESPLRLEIIDGRDALNDNGAVTLLATIHGGIEKDAPFFSSTVPLTITSRGTASLRLDSLLFHLAGTNITELKGTLGASVTDDWIAKRFLSLPTIFFAAVHFTPSGANCTSRKFPVSSVTLRAEEIYFQFSRELLSLHSELFCALLYGSFAEGGKDFLTLDSFNAEELRLLHNVMQKGQPVEIGKSVMALGVADLILCPGLKARMESVPIPQDIAIKEQWLLDADKYRLFDMAKSHDVMAKFFDNISNREIFKLLSLRNGAQKKIDSSKRRSAIASIFNGEKYNREATQANLAKLNPADYEYDAEEKENGKYKCTRCAKRYRTADLIISHVNSHTGEKPYQCTFCTKKYTGRYELVSHIARKCKKAGHASPPTKAAKK